MFSLEKTLFCLHESPDQITVVNSGSDLDLRLRDELIRVFELNQPASPGLHLLIILGQFIVKTSPQEEAGLQ